MPNNILTNEEAADLGILPFHTLEAYQLAKYLGTLIAFTEPPSNTDECMAATNGYLEQAISQKESIMHGTDQVWPVAEFHRAELIGHLAEQQDNPVSRYQVNLRA